MSLKFPHLFGDHDKNIHKQNSFFRIRAQSKGCVDPKGDPRAHKLVGMTVEDGSKDIEMGLTHSTIGNDTIHEQANSQVTVGEQDGAGKAMHGKEEDQSNSGEGLVIMITTTETSSEEKVVKRKET